jgi:hypothetical protein
MHVRRIACFLLGAWFAGCLVVALLGIQSPGAAERVLMNLTPSAAAQLHSIPPAQARALLRYAAAESNRARLERWDTVQLLGGIAFFVFLLFATREGKWSLAMVLWMVAMVLLQMFYLTPQLTDIGRLVDFAPAASAFGDRSKVWVLQNAYFLVEASKWAAGLALAAKLVWFSSRSGDARENLDVVNKADHRHIYR